VGHRGAPQDLRRLTPPPHGCQDVEVEVRLFANLADYGPPRGGGPVRVVVPVGATVQDLLERLRIPEGIPRLLLVNGQDSDPTTRLSPGDVVDILPPLAGG
jgi:molybdopterin converting factor small subunit